MKPFSLDTVLDFRKRKEEVAQGKFFEAKRERDRTKAELTRRKLNHKESIDSLMATQQEGAAIIDIITQEEKITFLKKKVAEYVILLENKEAYVKRTHQSLLDRSKEKKAMEKLKEKQNANWKKYLNKKEATMLDEIAVLRHNR